MRPRSRNSRRSCILKTREYVLKDSREASFEGGPAQHLFGNIWGRGAHLETLRSDSELTQKIDRQHIRPKNITLFLRGVPLFLGRRVRRVRQM